MLPPTHLGCMRCNAQQAGCIQRSTCRQLLAGDKLCTPPHRAWPVLRMLCCQYASVIYNCPATATRALRRLRPAGTRKEVSNPAMLSFLQAWAAPDAGSGLQLCMSVCTGAALLAAAGLLDGRRCVLVLLPAQPCSCIPDEHCDVEACRRSLTALMRLPLHQRSNATVAAGVTSEFGSLMQVSSRTLEALLTSLATPLNCCSGCCACHLQGDQQQDCLGVGHIHRPQGELGACCTLGA
jgi:hypothetical protein